MHSVCVFCGSSTGARAEYAKAAVALAEELVRRRLRVVYGGAGVGLMGVMADAALAAGGEVVGVIPRSMTSKELAHGGLSELHVTQSMHARKALMAELSDGFVALPGGYGTLEELAETLTWSQLGIQHKPCGLLDVAGFYGPLLSFLDHSTAEGFVRPENRRLVLAGTDPASLLDQMDAWQPPPTAAP